MDKKTAITVFSGMGGSAYGIQKAGLEDLLFIDKNEHARKMLKLNFPNVPIFIKDIKDEDGNELDGSDVLNISGNDILNKIGLKEGELFLYQSSAPCYDFTTLKSKKAKAKKGNIKNLFWESIEHIKIIKPHAYVFENVVGLLHDDIFISLLEALYELPYYFSVFEMNSIDYGSAQSRPRVFIVGYRKDLIDVKKGSTEEELIAQLRKANNGRLKPDYLDDRKPTKAPMTTPELKDQVKITKIIPDALLFFSSQFKGRRKNPAVSSMPTIMTTPSFFIMRKGMLPGDFAINYEENNFFIKPDYDEADEDRRNQTAAYEDELDDEYDDFEKEQLAIIHDSEISFMKDLYDKMDENESDWGDDEPDDTEQIQHTKKMIAKDMYALDSFVNYNFKIVGKIAAKYLPTLEQLLQFSDFPEDWKVGDSTYEEVWARCGDIVMPNVMEAITRQIVKELS